MFAYQLDRAQRPRSAPVSQLADPPVQADVTDISAYLAKKQAEAFQAEFLRRALSGAD